MYCVAVCMVQYVHFACNCMCVYCIFVLYICTVCTDTCSIMCVQCTVSTYVCYGPAVNPVEICMNNICYTCTVL